MAEIPEWMNEAIKKGYGEDKNLRDTEKDVIINLCEQVYAGGYTDLTELKLKFFYFLVESCSGLANNYPLYLLWIDEWYKGKTNG